MAKQGVRPERTIVDRVSTETLTRVAELLACMGSPVRLQILELVLNEEKSVTEIARHLEMSQSATSQHLSRLRRTELVKVRRASQTKYYFTDNPSVKNVLTHFGLR